MSTLNTGSNMNQNNDSKTSLSMGSKKSANNGPAKDVKNTGANCIQKYFVKHF